MIYPSLFGGHGLNHMPSETETAKKITPKIQHGDMPVLERTDYVQKRVAMVCSGGCGWSCRGLCSVPRNS